MRARIKASAAAWVCAFGGGWAAAVLCTERGDSQSRKHGDGTTGGSSTREKTLISISSRGDPKSARQLVKTGELAAPSTTSSRTDHVGLHVSTEGAEEVQPSIQHQEGGAVSPGDRIEGMDEDWTGHASTSPAGAGAVLESARSVYAELSGEILSRWGPRYANTTLFSGGMRFSDGGTVVENKFLNAVVEQRGFLAAFTGVSTTAGHDCLFEQSYPVVLEKTLGRLLGAAGASFEAINVAMGNTRVSPYSWCVEAHAGLDADIISWDMTMMVASNECGRAATAVEVFIRSASVLPKRPAVLLTDGSPNQETCTDGHFRQTQRQDQGLAGGCIPRRDLFWVYRDFGLHQISPRSIVPEVTCGDDVFARDHLYNNTEKDTPRPVKWHAGPAGHVLLADMLFMHYAEVFLRALERLDAAWPGVTAADLRDQGGNSSGEGRSSLRVSLGLEEAGGGEIEDSRGSGNSAAFMGGGRGGILPPPAWCKGWRFCEWAGNYRCASTYYPLAGKEGSRLLDMVSEGTPVMNRNRLEHFVEPSNGRWAVTLNEEAKSLKDYLLVPPPKGFHHPIDMKWVLVGDKNSGPIEFEFETVGIPSGKGRGVRHRRAAVVGEGGGGEKLTTSAAEKKSGSGAATGTSEVAAQFDSRVTVCKPDFIGRVAFNESDQVRFSLDGVQVPAVELVQYGLYPRACVLLDAEVGVGRHTLRVEPMLEGEPYVAVSHVLYRA